MDSKEYEDLRLSARAAAHRAGAEVAWLDDIADEAIAKYLSQQMRLRSRVPGSGK